MPSSTVENYVKQVYLEQPAGSEELVAMGRLASAMGVTPGTATSMVKALVDLGLADYEPRNGVRLSNQGQKLALHVLRRHRLVELLLVNVLGLDWSEVHDEAERLEHAISDKVLDRIDALLGHPTVDPHGDPIPTAKGKLRRLNLLNLMDCPVQIPHRIARVIDQDPQYLQFAHRHGLTPGALVCVLSCDEIADAVTLRLQDDAQHGDALTLGATAARKLLVEPIEPVE